MPVGSFKRVGLGSNKLRLHEILRSKALSESTSKAEDVKRLLKVEGNRLLGGSYDDNMKYSWKYRLVKN